MKYFVVKRLLGFFSNTFVAKKLPFILSSLAIFSALLTYALISYGGISLASRTSVIMPFIVFDVIIIVLLAVTIAQRVFFIVREHLRGAIGARLHIVIISLFSVVAITPSVVVAVLSLTFFKSGVSIWFSKPVKDTLNDASVVAELYLQEHMRVIRAESDVVANYVKHLMLEYDLFLPEEKKKFQQELDSILEEKNLNEALVSVRNKVTNSVTSVNSSFALLLELYASEKISVDDIRSALAGEIIVKENQGFVRAFVCFDSAVKDTETYLWIGKHIDQKILRYVTKARDSMKYYNDLLENQNRFLVTLITLFALSSLLLLLAAIWTGINLADILVLPITKLIAAADRISKGDLSVRVEGVSNKSEVYQLVESFNRMTERLEQQNKDLIISEKKATWSDIARKIAHEVKNPLTPIQLSAERIRKKYLSEISSDPATFEKCLDTIIRQVSYIENLISEFSNFARMPEAVIKPVEIIKLIEEAVFLQKQSFKSIRYLIEYPQGLHYWNCDGQQIMQVLLNLLNNAANAITEEKEKIAGKIVVMVNNDKDVLSLIVEDNGPGFPSENREKLFEPYYTTRKNGTGLGMAIVLRIVTEHGGSLILKEAVGHRGARVEINLPMLNCVEDEISGLRVKK